MKMEISLEDCTLAKWGVLASNSEKSVSQENEQIGSAEVEGKISHVRTRKVMRLRLNQEGPPNMLTWW